jgi:4-amino-4-deoxy-L-arabinose transferase-like glycosyltransferase
MTAAYNLQPPASVGLRPRVLIALTLVWYFVATLPQIGDFPLVGQDEAWIAAPAAKLATQGVYGDDLFAGYYRMEQHAYNFPPLFPLSEALAFTLLGVGVWQARLVAVLFGAATLVLTYLLGVQLYGEAVGVLAAWLLVALRLALEPQASGVPMVDLARIARYDIAVPPLVLATLLCFLWAERAGARATEDGRSRSSLLAPRSSIPRYLATGLLAGLAMLAHVYGGFVLAPIALILLWRYRSRVVRQPAPYLVAAGCSLALLPWALYIAMDLAAYRGQMLPEQTRFRVWEPFFYLDSLLHEPSRYQRLLQLDGATVLWPRVGIWLALIGLPLSFGMLLKRTLSRMRSTTCAADRLLLLTLPTLALLLALLVNLKFYNYIVLLLPFLSLNLAFVITRCWQASGAWLWKQRSVARLAMSGVLTLALLEGLLGIWQSLRNAATTSSYRDYTQRVAAVMPPGARVLALHQFWFGVYDRGYVYRSMALVFYLSDPRYYRPAPLPMDAALELVAPEYVLVDRAMAPELRMDQPIGTIADDQRRRFRQYLAKHCARPVAQIDDSDYGDLTIYHLCR